MKISVVIPVFNSQETVERCVDALIGQLYPKKLYEIIAVNDGSTDSTREILARLEKRAKKSGVRMTVVDLKGNRGRIVAREEGAKMAGNPLLLFIDSRCIADGTLLRSVRALSYEPVVGNPFIDWRRSKMDRFNFLIRRKLYPYSFGYNFKDLIIDRKNFDTVGKGTGLFICSKKLFLNSQLISKGKNVSDDTKLLRNIVQRTPILKTSKIRAKYLSRLSLTEELRHSFQRGPKFVDYYYVRGRRYYNYLNFFVLFVFVNIYFLIANQMMLLLEFQFLLLTFLVISLYLSANRIDFMVLITYLPLFSVAFFFGVGKGLILRLLRIK